ncbi:heme peroxidase [Scenedesmus sp. NREL 46B-D3]|nr:heme peroxidase [Scenedesmus sp. NREL 46B-D3]
MAARQLDVSQREHRKQRKGRRVLGVAQRSDRAKWEALGEYIWEFLKEVDFDFVGSSGYVVPPGVPGSKSVTGVACGRVSRLWIRMPFHDCGTFNVNKKTGGCNGSLRKELPETMPLQDVKTGKVLSKDVFDQLGDDKVRADYAIDHRRKENTDEVRAHKELGLAASCADVMVYSGMLGVHMCGGPAIRFVPGRNDRTFNQLYLLSQNVPDEAQLTAGVQ